VIDMGGPVICGIEDANGASAAEVAHELARRLDVPLHYVHVLDGAGDAERAVGVLREVADGAGELEIDDGEHPADRLVELAEQRGASFLVVGNHGPRSSLLGSISAEVSRRAPCPVIVVPPTAAPAQSEAAGEEPALVGGILRFGAAG
jgi:nucleotide-binding universal stress UspA family protein